MVKDMMKAVMEEVRDHFEARKIGGGEWTEQRLKDLVSGIISTEMGELEGKVKVQVTSPVEERL